MEVKIVRVSHLSNDKNGNPLIAKNGRPYTRCLIDLEDGRKASGFGSALTKTWKDGDTVDIELEQSGQYWNFSVKKVDLESRVAKLEEAVFGNGKVPAVTSVEPSLDDF